MNDTDNPAISGEAGKEPPEAAPETPAGRDARGRFAKGAPSANPKGRPTESHELKALAREKSPEAIKRLLFWLRSDDPTASIAAAKELLSRGYGRPEQSIAVDATITPGRVYPSMLDMSATDAAQAYQEILRNPNVTFLPPTPKAAADGYAEMMRVGVDAALAAPARPRPQVLAAPPEMLQARTSTAAPAAGPPEQPSAAPAPREAAVDPADPSVVAVIEEPLRHFHEHRPKPDSPCPRCRALWVRG